MFIEQILYTRDWSGCFGHHGEQNQIQLQLSWSFWAMEEAEQVTNHTNELCCCKGCSLLQTADT